MAAQARRVSEGSAGQTLGKPSCRKQRFSPYLFVCSLSDIKELLVPAIQAHKKFPFVVFVFVDAGSRAISSRTRALKGEVGTTSRGAAPSSAVVISSLSSASSSSSRSAAAAVGPCVGGAFPTPTPYFAGVSQRCTHPMCPIPPSSPQRHPRNRSFGPQLGRRGWLPAVVEWACLAREHERGKEWSGNWSS